MIIKSRENKLPLTKIPQKFTPGIFTLLNFNQIGCKQCNENDQMASVFCYFQLLYMKSGKNYSHEYSLKSKFTTIFHAKPENPKSAKLNTHKNLLPHGFRRCGNCERFCLSCNLRASVSRFQQSRIRELRKFFGQESHRPPSPKVPYAYDL